MPRRYKPYYSTHLANRHQNRKRVAWLLFALLGVFSFATILWFSAVLLPFILGIIIAYVFSPAVNYLAEKRVPRIFVILMLYALLLGSIYGFLHYMFPKMQAESRRFASRFQGAPEKVTEWINSGGVWLEGWFGEETDDMSSERKASLSTLSRYGLGPDSYRVGTGYERGHPGLSEQGPKTIFGPSSELVRELGISGGHDTAYDERLEGSQILATVHGNQVGLQIRDSMFEFRRLGDGTYQLRPKYRAAARGSKTPSDLRVVLRDTVNSVANDMSGSLVLGTVKFVRGLLNILTKGLVGLVVTLMVAAFILLDNVQISRFFRELAPPRYEHLYDELLWRFDTGLSGVIRGQLLICLINGILSGIGFFIFVPEYALVLALLATVMSLIPIFGTIISTIPACILALSVGGWSASMAVLGWVLGIHFVEANVLNPKIIGHAAKINPVVVVFVLLAGEHAYGLKGALLAVPITAMVIAVGQFIYARIRPTIMED